jgi:hypothetical protein
VNPFLLSIVRDGRSFDLKIFEQTLVILKNKKLLSDNLIAQFEQFVNDLRIVSEQEKEEDSALIEEEIPEVTSSFLETTNNLAYTHTLTQGSLPSYIFSPTL